MSPDTSSLLPEHKRYICSYSEDCKEQSVAWTILVDYFKGYICIKCVGIAMKAHEDIIEKKMAKERAGHE